MKMDQPDFFPRYANQYVEDMTYSADVSVTGEVTMDLGKPVVADADGILAGHSIADAGNAGASDFADTYSDEPMGRYGRNITVAASGAATSGVVVRGLDYLGQPMSEEFSLNGTTSVVGNKAFKYIDSVEYEATAERTINVGWGTKLGLPYAITQMTRELVDGAAPGSAGTVVAADTRDPADNTNDPRGTYAPHNSSIANGERSYKIVGYVLPGQMHGKRHYNAD